METVLVVVFFAALLLPWALEYFRTDKGGGLCDNCDGEGYFKKQGSTDNTPCKKCGGKGYTN